MPIINPCLNCGSIETKIDSKVDKNGVPRLKEVCATCDRFVKWAPLPITLDRARAFKFEVGKHIGKTMAQIKEIDSGYLKWVIEQSTHKANVKEMAKLILQA